MYCRLVIITVSIFYLKRVFQDWRNCGLSSSSSSSGNCEGVENTNETDHSSYISHSRVHSLALVKYPNKIRHGIQICAEAVGWMQ